MSKFKVGDKVRLKAGPLVGNEGVVTRLSSCEDIYIVAISKDVTFALEESDIELIEDTKPEFKVGDIVEAFGVRGVVERIHSNYSSSVPVVVRLDNGVVKSFYLDGRAYSWAKEPTLKLIERPKKKEKRVVKVWVNVYSTGERYAYPSKEEAELGADETAIAIAVEMTGEYEVEVE